MLPVPRRPTSARTGGRRALNSERTTVADVEKGEVLWIHPEQWARSGHPDGFALRVVGLLGEQESDPVGVWVRGVALDRGTGLPVQEIVMLVPPGQPRADQRDVRDRGRP